MENRWKEKTRLKAKLKGGGTFFADYRVFSIFKKWDIFSKSETFFPKSETFFPESETFFYIILLYTFQI